MEIEIRETTKRRRINKKSQIFMMLLVFVTLTTIISIYFVLSEKRANVKNDFGKESMNLISGYQEEQKLLHTIQLQAKFAYYQSVYDLGLSGGVGIENNCGKYRGFINYYNDPELQQCLPLTPEKELAALMNKEMRFVEEGIDGNKVSVFYNTELKDNYIIGKANGSIAYTYDSTNQVLNLGSIEVKQLSPDEYAQLYHPNTIGSPSGSGVKQFPTCDKTEDVIIELSNEKEKPENQVNYGRIWIPAEALCGGEFPLLIMLHGHSRPEIAYIGEKAGYRVDKDVRILINERKIYPVILAAPLGIKTTKGTPWPAGQLDIDKYIARIQEEVKKHNPKIAISKVGMTGHSAANCYTNTALQYYPAKYNFYFVGSADGTCGNFKNAVGTDNYAQEITQKIGKKDTIYVLMHRNSERGDQSSEAFMTENSADDSADSIAKDNYVSVVKKNNREYYRYLLDPQKYRHDTVPKIMIIEILQRFFTLEKVGSIAPYAAVYQDIQLGSLGCKRTQYNINSESIGTPNCGALKNAVLFVRNTDYYKSDHDTKKAYATVELVNIIEDIGCVLTAKSNYGPQGKVAVGQTSYEYGGKLYAHSSHQSGRDADIGFFFRDKKQQLVSMQTVMVNTKTNAVDPRFDLEANWLFVREFFKHDLAESIFIYGALEDALIAYAEQHNEDKSLIEKAKQKMVGGYEELGHDHRDHYHIRIKCPHGDNLCKTKYKKCHNYYIAQAK